MGALSLGAGHLRRYAGALLFEAPEDEQEKAQAVQVAPRAGVRVAQGQAAALSPPDRSPRQVERARPGSRPGQDEALGHRHFGLQLVRDLLQMRDVRLFHESEVASQLGVGAELRPELVEAALELFADLAHAGVWRQSLGQADRAGGFVDSTGGLDPRVVLTRAATAEKARRAVIAASGDGHHSLPAARHPIHSSSPRQCGCYSL